MSGCLFLVAAAALVILILMTGGCMHSSDVRTEVVTEYVPKAHECGTPPARDKMLVQPVEWRILPVDNEQLFTLDADQYRNLGENVSQVILGIQQLKGELGFYKACIAESHTEAKPETKTD